MKISGLILLLVVISITSFSQEFVKIDQDKDHVLFKSGNDFVSYNFKVRTDSAYMVFFEKGYIDLSTFKKVKLAVSPSQIPAEQQKLCNAGLPKINIEFVEIVKLSTSNYKIAFQYTQGSNVPHYYCLEVESAKDPKFSAEFFQIAKKISASYCGDEY